MQTGAADRLLGLIDLLDLLDLPDLPDLLVFNWLAPCDGLPAKRWNSVASWSAVPRAQPATRSRDVQPSYGQ